MEKFDEDIIRDVLANDDRVIFAYLYGSFSEGEGYRDIDIAVYSQDNIDPFKLSADLKVKLYELTGIPPDFFDIRIINRLIKHGDLLTLLYLKNVFQRNEILVDKDFDKRSDYIEKYSMKYRECEGLINEVMI